MASAFREYRIHHTTPDGVLVQLPGTAGGFGRLSRATLGDDTLADRLLRSLSTRDHIPAVMKRSRDAQGYRMLSVNLLEASSELVPYPDVVRCLVPRLFRKHLLVGLGTTTAAKVLRVTKKGTVFSIPPNMRAVAALEQVGSEDDAEAPPQSKKPKREKESVSDEEGDEEEGSVEGSTAAGYRANDMVEVRLLNYDVTMDVVNVSARHEFIEETPVDTAVSAQALATLVAGQVVHGCTVLLSSTDDGCAVLRVPVSSSPPCSVLGYYVYAWPGEVQEKPVVGSTLSLMLEYAPSTDTLREAVPFVILSHRVQSFNYLPAVRRALPTTTAASAGSSSKSGFQGLMGFFAWREDYRLAMQRTDLESEDEDDANFYENGRGKGDKNNASKLRKRKLEEAIDAYERGMEKAVPTSPEEFQRLLLATPNSSYLWTHYMAHHVGLQQYESARQVAEKALNTIGVREAEERLNVWVAYLNVENLYGTDESLAAVFRRALQRQLDELPLYMRLADIYASSRKPNQLLALCRVMTGKFRSDRRTWERLGTVLVDQNKRDQLKRTIKDMSSALKRDEAALAVVHIGIHEYKQGTAENGRALFEGLLSKVPKKSDVWSTFIDQELGLLNRRAPAASAAHVRNVFQRAVAMNFSAKVMQQFLTRFLSFEQAHGTPAEVEAVKERARAYVEGKIQAVANAGLPE